MPRRKRVVVSEEELVYGPEPIWDDVEITDDNYTSLMVSALNWYNVVPSSATKKAWLVELAEDLGFTKSQIRSIPEAYLNSIAACARIDSRGVDVRHDYKTDLEKLVNRFEKTDKEEPKQILKVDTTIGEVIGPLEDVLQDVLHGKTKWVIPELAHPLNGVQTKDVMKIFKDMKVEFELANSGDEDFSEAYPQGKRVLNRAIKCVDEILAKLDQTLTVTKVRKPRKPRKKKFVPASKHVAKLNFKATHVDGDFALKSISPEKIIGAKALIVFNTKTRQFQFYLEDVKGVGLQCKGSTLSNFSEAGSTGKTVRKPAEIMPKVLTGTYNKALKTYHDIKAVDKPLTGRINKDCILVRGF